MTRDEFITRYMKRSGIPSENKTDDGFVDGNWKHTAIPCDCDYEKCHGWQMNAEEKT